MTQCESLGASDILRHLISGGESRGGQLWPPQPCRCIHNWPGSERKRAGMKGRGLALARSERQDKDRLLERGGGKGGGGKACGKALRSELVLQGQ